jgi:Co/Zn/Cd efflux system component
VFAGIEWEDLELVGAFTAGAILATIAVLRVIRAVVTIFSDTTQQHRRRR